MARRRLLTYPDYQAEVIAKHYASHATVALQILKLVECHRSAGSGSNYPMIDHTIQMLVDTIKDSHWHDFGIELNWENEHPTR